MAKGGDPDEPATPRRRGAALSWLVLALGVLLGVVGVLLVLGLTGVDRAGLFDFVRSAGFGGVCAIVVAFIALFGITRQVEAARAATDQARRNAAAVLEQQQRSDAAARWWERFEWASSRAIPADPREVPLPYETLVTAFQALLSDATDEVQRRAVAGITAEASRRAVPTSGVDEERSGMRSSNWRASLRTTLQGFLDAADAAGVRSAETEYRLYELDVIEALARLEDRGVRLVALPDEEPRRSQSGYRPDAVVMASGRSVAVEVRRGRLSRLLLEQHAERFPEGSLVVVTSVAVPPALRRPGERIRVVRWVEPADDAALLEAIEGVASQAGGR